MSDTKRRRFRRPIPELRYRRLFVISTEGTNTERQYFSLFNNEFTTIQVKWLKGKKSGSPKHVLKRIKNFLKDEKLRKTDEAWIVVDKDDWGDDQLQELHDWSATDKKYNLALSNPKFEYWLLLHFEEGTQISTSAECSFRLQKRLPEYNKNIEPKKFTSVMIQDAVRRAKKRDKPRCSDWPRAVGQTTVYRLVENILNAAAEK